MAPRKAQKRALKALTDEANGGDDPTDDPDECVCFEPARYCTHVRSHACAALSSHFHPGSVVGACAVGMGSFERASTSLALAH